MNFLLQRVRNMVLIFLLLLCVAWAFGEAAQQLLRWHAQHLLADIQSLQVNRTTWSDALPTMQKWSQWGSAKAGCSEAGCDYRINLVQTLPPLLIGSPASGERNWLPRLINHLGLRTAAIRAGITVERGVVTSKWFGEQTTLPVRDWTGTDDYIPYLSVAATESAHFHEHTAGDPLQHPNRMTQHVKTYLEINYSPEEDPSERSTLMAFRFNCITQLHPCEIEGDILPASPTLIQEQQLSLPTR